MLLYSEDSKEGLPRSEDAMNWRGSEMKRARGRGEGRERSLGEERKGIHGNERKQPRNLDLFSSFILFLPSSLQNHTPLLFS